MKRIGMSSLLLSLLLAGCMTEKVFVSGPVLEARKLIEDNRAECVVISDGETLEIKRGHGISPLLDFYENTPDKLDGAIVVDKVIGRAAAAVMICSGVKAAYGETMSEDGKAFLEEHGILAGYGRLVPRILNADRKELCPLEKAVLHYPEPKFALEALRRKVAEFKGKAKK